MSRRGRVAPEPLGLPDLRLRLKPEGDEIEVKAFASGDGEPVASLHVRAVGWPGHASVYLDPRTCAGELRQLADRLDAIATHYGAPRQRSRRTGSEAAASPAVR